MSESHFHSAGPPLIPASSPRERSPTALSQPWAGCSCRPSHVLQYREGLLAPLLNERLGAGTTPLRMLRHRGHVLVEIKP